MPLKICGRGFGTGLVLVVLVASQTGCSSESTLREDRTLDGDSGSAGEGVDGTGGRGSGGEDASGGRASGGRGGAAGAGGSDGGAGPGGLGPGGARGGGIAGTADGGGAGEVSTGGEAVTSGGSGGTTGGGEAGEASAVGGAAPSGGAGGNGEAGGPGGAAAGGAPAGGTGGASGHAGSAGAAGASSSCGAGWHCALPAPADWLGPVVVGLGSLPCSAAGGYPKKELDLHSGILPGTPDCVCECAADSTTCRASVTNWDNSICDDNPLGGSWLDVGSCVGLDCYSETYVGLEVRPSGSCTMQESSSIPTPTWAEDLRVCGGASDLGGCGGGQLCLPEPAAPFPDTCVYREGSHACPAEYPVRTVRHQGFDDLRSCSECTCGALSGARCEAVVDLYSGSGGNDCATLGANDHVLTYPADPFCLGCGGYDGAILRSTAVIDAGSCSPIGGEPSGSVVETGATTLCCML